MVALEGSTTKITTCGRLAWSHLKGQDLWVIVASDETTSPENVKVLQKWKIKDEKAMFAIKTIIKEEMLEHIRHVNTPKRGTPFQHYFQRRMM